MTKTSAFLYLISALGHISTSEAACTRALLKSTIDTFLTTAVSKSGASSLKISPNVKIVENNIRKKSIQETIHSYVAGYARPFRLNAIDTQTCSVAALVVVNTTEQDPPQPKGTVPNKNDDCKGSGVPATAGKSAGKTTGKTTGKGAGKDNGASTIFSGDPTAPIDGNNPWPNLISVRIQIAEGSGEVTELEIVNVGTGKGGNAGTLMQTASMPQSVGPIWSQPLLTNSSKQPTRDELVKILDSYPEGIHIHKGSGVQSAEKCQRIENGRRMPFTCNSNYEGLTQNVTNRAWVVDTETGISLGKFFFERPFSPFWIHEYFKITEGKIQEIYAAIIPWGCSSFKDNLVD